MKDKPPRARKLRQHYYDAARTFNRAVWDGDGGPALDAYEVTTERERRRIMRGITRLADECGVAHEQLDYGAAYTEAIKRLGGTDKGHRRALALRRLAEEIDRRVRERRRPRPAEEADEWAIHINADTAGIIGYAVGEVVNAVGARDLKAGDAGCAWEGDELATVGRVVAADAAGFTLRWQRDDERPERRFDYDSCAFAGRILGACSPFDRETRARLEDLRGQLDRLGKEDDRILRCTERLRIEREIYDLEHPPDEDPDEWPEEIRG